MSSELRGDRARTKKTTIFQNFTPTHGTANVSPVAVNERKYITSCHWRTNSRYVRAGAGTSHGCRDEARGRFRFPPFLIRPLYASRLRFFFFGPFFSCPLVPRRGVSAAEIRNPQNSCTTALGARLILILS